MEFFDKVNYQIIDNKIVPPLHMFDKLLMTTALILITIFIIFSAIEILNSFKEKKWLTIIIIFIINIPPFLFSLILLQALSS